MAQLRELDLQFPLAAARVLREDVEDHHRSIDDRQRNRLLEVRPLARPQIVEDEDLRRAEFFGARGDLARLPRTDERRGIDRGEPLHHAPTDASAGRNDQRLELFEFGFEGPPRVAQIDCDDQGALAFRGDLFHEDDVGRWDGRDLYQRVESSTAKVRPIAG